MFKPPRATAARAIPPLIQVAIVGCPVLESLARNPGANLSIARDCRTLGPPRTLPKADDKIAPNIPGTISQAPNKAIADQVPTPRLANPSKLTLFVIDNNIGINRYISVPEATARIVPFGIDFLGSFKSPLIPIPAVNPVTAGKNTANTYQNPFGAVL